MLVSAWLACVVVTMFVCAWPPWLGLPTANSKLRSDGELEGEEEEEEEEEEEDS